MLDLQQARQRAAALRRRIAALNGAKAESVARREAVVRDVALAKGRVDLRERVEAFLEELQQDAHRRNVGSFERLLSLLVEEVLPGAHPIGFDLSTERGLPSLDVFSRLPDGSREDVYADQGGALTNIVSTGLRIIAVVKSRGRAFLLLDEPDCWIRPDRVPDFYKVLRQAAERLKVQCLVISHHSRELFGPGIAIATFDPDAGRIVSPSPADFPWPADAPGIRSVKLVNFQAHAEAELRLAPGVTALVGPNNRGKSSFTRAFSAVFYGETRDSLIRHGEKGCTVSVEIENGRSIRFSRERKRNPVNIWSFHEADGSIVEEEGIRFETGGRSVPEWVSAKSGLATVDGLDVHVADQKRPVFLLSDPPAKRASVLSVGQESGHLRSMISIQKERTTRDQATIRNGEREITEIDRRLGELADTQEWDSAVAEAEAALEDIAGAAARTARIEQVLASIDLTQRRLAACQRKAQAYAELPQSHVVHDIVQASARGAAATKLQHQLTSAMTSADRARRRGAALSALHAPPALLPTDRAAILMSDATRGAAAVTRLRKLKSALAELPAALPVLVNNGRLIEIGVAIRKGVEAAASARTKATGLGEDLGRVEAEMQSLVEDMGGTCPTCHQPVDAAQLLAHSHGEAQ